MYKYETIIYWSDEDGEASIVFNDELDDLNGTELLDLAEDCIAVFDGIQKEGWRKTGAKQKSFPATG